MGKEARAAAYFVKCTAVSCISWLWRCAVTMPNLPDNTNRAL